MFGILKRTTAIAALAGLTIAPAALAEGQQQGQQQGQIQVQPSDINPPGASLVPSDEQIKTYKSQRDAAPENAEVIRTESGEYVERSAEELQGDESETVEAGEKTLPRRKENPGEGEATFYDKTPESAQNVGVSDQEEAVEQAEGGETELTDEGDTPEVFQGQNTQPGVLPGAPPAQEQAGATLEDLLIATVGGTEIRRSDVLDAIAQLPPQLQQQPAEMLIPLAVDQLVTRELILQEAREGGLAEDEEVGGMLSADASEAERENAMIQVWLERQLEDRVTDEEVTAAYETVKAQFGDQTPALDDLRPQIEGQLRQQAFAEISSDLQADAEITVYGPDGKPLSQ